MRPATGFSPRHEFSIRAIALPGAAPRRQRPPRPPQMQRARMPVPDRLLPHAGGVDRVQRQGDFDEFLAVLYSAPSRPPAARIDQLASGQCGRLPQPGIAGINYRLANESSSSCRSVYGQGPTLPRTRASETAASGSSPRRCAARSGPLRPGPLPRSRPTPPPPPPAGWSGAARPPPSPCPCRGRRGPGRAEPCREAPRRGRLDGPANGSGSVHGRAADRTPLPIRRAPRRYPSRHPPHLPPSRTPLADRARSASICARAASGLTSTLAAST